MVMDGKSKGADKIGLRTVVDVRLPDLERGQVWRVRWFHRIGQRLIASGVVLETSDRTSALITFKSKVHEYVPRPTVRTGVGVQDSRKIMYGDARTGKYVVIESVTRAQDTP